MKTYILLGLLVLSSLLIGCGPSEEQLRDKCISICELADSLHMETLEGALGTASKNMSINSVEGCAVPAGHPNPKFIYKTQIELCEGLVEAHSKQ